MTEAVSEVRNRIAPLRHARFRRWKSAEPLELHSAV